MGFGFGTFPARHEACTIFHSSLPKGLQDTEFSAPRFSLETGRPFIQCLIAATHSDAVIVSESAVGSKPESLCRRPQPLLRGTRVAVLATFWLRFSI